MTDLRWAAERALRYIHDNKPSEDLEHDLTEALAATGDADRPVQGTRYWTLIAAPLLEAWDSDRLPVGFRLLNVSPLIPGTLTHVALVEDALAPPDREGCLVTPHFTRVDGGEVFISAWPVTAPAVAVP